MDKAVIERYWKNVIPGELESDCWEWNASVSSNGYGNVCLRDANGRKMNPGAHRLAWMIHNGKNRVPKGKMVLHSCGFLVDSSPTCTNGLHLRLGTASENQLDRYRKARRAKIIASGDYMHFNYATERAS